MSLFWRVSISRWRVKWYLRNAPKQYQPQLISIPSQYLHMTLEMCELELCQRPTGLSKKAFSTLSLPGNFQRSWYQLARLRGSKLNYQWTIPLKEDNKWNSSRRQHIHTHLQWLYTHWLVVNSLSLANWLALKSEATICRNDHIQKEERERASDQCEWKRNSHPRMGKETEKMACIDTTHHRSEDDIAAVSAQGWVHEWEGESGRYQMKRCVRKTYFLQRSRKGSLQRRRESIREEDDKKCKMNTSLYHVGAFMVEVHTRKAKVDIVNYAAKLGNSTQGAHKHTHTHTLTHSPP